MKVIFVSSGNNKKYGINSFINEQAESLKRQGVEVDHYLILGSDIVTYLGNIFKLRTRIKAGNYDLIHAHYVLSGWVSLLAFSGKPIVLSLMGTDAYGKIIGPNKTSFFSRYLTLLTLLIQPFVSFIISKSPNIEKYVYLKKKSLIIPNGVDLNKFSPTETSYHKELGMDTSFKNIVFMGDKNDVRKNFQYLLAIEDKLNKAGCKIVAPYPVSHDKVIKYLNSADVLVMCSFNEGSPNIVKEAMACNCKAVLTDVGDVRYLAQGVKGYAIADFNPDDVFEKILLVLEQKECGGRQQLLDLKLDIVSVADRIKNLYEQLIKN